MKAFGDWHADRDWVIYKPGTPQEYAIEGDRLCEKRDDLEGAANWVVHLLEKDWVDMEQFMPAFRYALALRGEIDDIDWKATRRAAVDLIYEGICYNEAVRRLGRDSSLVTPSQVGKEFELATELMNSFWRPEALPWRKRAG